jgi:hypothetical protein
VNNTEYTTLILPYPISINPVTKYAPLLNKIFGEKGKDWTWELKPNSIDEIEVRIYSRNNKENLTLFLLSI